MGALTAPCAVQAPFGWLILTLSSGGRLVSVDLARSRRGISRCPVRHIIEQFEHYFADPHHRIQLPSQVLGTPFQQRVWKAIAHIASGKVRTYGSLAQSLHTAPRAVGGACGANPIPILVPCHRVVSQGGVGGYTTGAADSVALKEWLLHHEGIL